jgi:hypothetical protein
LFDGIEAPGVHTVVWDGKDEAGRVVDSGVFWVHMAAGDGYRASTKLVLLK